jgi:NUMOD3 motif
MQSTFLYSKKRSRSCCRERESRSNAQNEPYHCLERRHPLWFVVRPTVGGKCQYTRIALAVFLLFLVGNGDAWSHSPRNARYSLIQPPTSTSQRIPLVSQRHVSGWRRLPGLSSTETDTATDIFTRLSADANARMSNDSVWANQSDSDLESLMYGTDDDVDEVPQPTENGGFSHTKASRAKISAANKGKTPWNKGVHRTEEAKAKIGMGVRARNRERFLEKLAAMGLTEQEYEEQKRKERREKEAERRARKTEKGGYRPTEETKRRISSVLKQKHAAGEIKRRTINPENVRRGFTHSEETRRKISASLRSRWANDPDYRAKMIQISNTVNTLESVRQKISESLREKWRDETFRESMMSKMANRTLSQPNQQRNPEHRARISAAMKAKWQDETYRNKTREAMAKSRANSSSNSTLVRKKTAAAPSKKASTNSVDQRNLPLTGSISPRQPLSVVKLNDSEENMPVRALQPRSEPNGKALGRKLAAKKSRAASAPANPTQPKLTSAVDGVNRGEEGIADLDAMLGFADESVANGANAVGKTQGTSKRVESAPPIIPLNGSVDMLKEDRPDLFNLLYSDDYDEDDEENGHDDGDVTSSTLSNEQHKAQQRLRKSKSRALSAAFALEDDNLDTFDPYGLDDF